MPMEGNGISFLNQPVGLKGNYPWETNRGLSCITTGAVKEYCSGHGHTHRSNPGPGLLEKERQRVHDIASEALEGIELNRKHFENIRGR
jgi:hypothetical protein